MVKKFRMVGITDDANECSCCGRQDLKRVVWMVPLDPDGNPEGEAAPYGTSCAATLLGYAYPKSSTSKRKIEVEAMMARRRTVEDAVAEIRKAHLTRVGVYFVLTDLVEEVQAGRMTLKQAEDERERRYPLLRFYSGKIGYDEAFRLIMAK